MAYPDHHKRRPEHLESPLRNRRCMDSRKDTISDESIRAHCDQHDPDSSGVFAALYNLGAEVVKTAIQTVGGYFAPTSSPADQHKTPSKKSSRRRQRKHKHTESPSYAAQIPLPSSPSDYTTPFQNLVSVTSTSVKRYDTWAETQSQLYSNQNSPSSSRSARRASSAALANGVNKSYHPNRKHIRHKQHQYVVGERRTQDLMQLSMKRGQSAAEVNGFLSYSERVSKFYADDAFPTSRRLTSVGLNLAPSRLSPNYGKKAELEHQLHQNIIERAIRRALDALESTRTSQQDFSVILAKLGDINKPEKPVLPKALSPEDQAEVTATFKKRGPISKVAREQVSDKDIARLKPSQWLNDEVINFYGALIMARSEEAKKGKGKALDAHYFNTFFFAKLEDPGYEKARIGKWTKKIDIFKKDVVLIPVNLGNSHWTCAAINFVQKRIEYHDSMGTKRGKVYKYLRDYLNKEHRDKKKTDFDFTGWVDYFDENAPQQENGYDCGVFSCQYMECISRGADFHFNQGNMTYLRQRMVLEIMRAKLWDQQ